MQITQWDYFICLLTLILITKKKISQNVNFMLNKAIYLWAYSQKILKKW